MPVLPDGKSNIGGNVQFERAIEYGNKFTTFGMDDGIGCSLFAVQRTLPGVLRSLQPVFARFLACRWQQMVAVEQQVACDRWMDVGKVGQHKDFSIMKDVAAI